MASILLWLGLTLILAVPLVANFPLSEKVGAILMIIGVIFLMVGR